MPWRRRRTARWASLSLEARAVVLEVVMAMDEERRELELGPLGLRSLERLIGAPWEEIEPAIAEVLRVGKLVHDEVRGVLIDDSRARSVPLSRPPTEVDKRELIAGVGAITPDVFVRALQAAAERSALAAVAAKRPKPKKAPRELSMTRNAIRLRAGRALAKAGRPPEPTPPTGTDGRSFTATNETNERTNATAPTASSEPSAITPEEQRSFAFAERTPLSDLKIYKSDQQKSRNARSSIALVNANVLADDGLPTPVPMLNGWLARMLDIRPDMNDALVRRVWTKFARAKTGKFDAWGEVAARFESWIIAERLGPRDVKPVPPTGPKKSSPRRAAGPPEEPRAEDGPQRLAELQAVLSGICFDPPRERAA